MFERVIDTPLLIKKCSLQARIEIKNRNQETAYLAGSTRHTIKAYLLKLKRHVLRLCANTTVLGYYSNMIFGKISQNPERLSRFPFVVGVQYFKKAKTGAKCNKYAAPSCSCNLDPSKRQLQLIAIKNV